MAFESTAESSIAMHFTETEIGHQRVRKREPLTVSNVENA